MLKAQHLFFFAKHRKIINDVSIGLLPGRLTALVGPNGAGKSTLMKILSGELTPHAGHVEVEGRPLKQWPLAEIARFRAVLPQELHLAFPFRVIEVVLLGRIPHLYGRETRQDYDIAHEVLAQVNMGDCRERLYPTLSGGEKQRVQTARVLAQIWEPLPGHTSFLLLDEPTASLDLAHRYATLQIARGLAARGVAVLVILHDLNLATAYADNVLVMHEGQIVVQGRPREVFQPEIIAQVFKVEAKIVDHPENGILHLITQPQK